jgi:hypothetical protein
VGVAYEDGLILIEKFMFDYLVLSPAASEQADGRRFSFKPLPLLFTGVEAIDAKLKEEAIKMPMNEVLLPHLMEMAKKLHLLAQPSHWVKGLYAKFYMSPSNIKHIDSGPCRLAVPLSSSATGTYIHTYTA